LEGSRTDTAAEDEAEAEDDDDDAEGSERKLCHEGGALSWNDRIVSRKKSR